MTYTAQLKLTHTASYQNRHSYIMPHFHITSYLCINNSNDWFKLRHYQWTNFNEGNFTCNSIFLINIKPHNARYNNQIMQFWATKITNYLDKVSELFDLLLNIHSNEVHIWGYSFKILTVNMSSYRHWLCKYIIFFVIRWQQPKLIFCLFCECIFTTSISVMKTYKHKTASA